MEYITTKEASRKWGISTTRITILANEGRIPGAYRLGKSWLIPAGATKPQQFKANHSKSSEKKTNDFSFPLYHFRPDWNPAMETQLSEQQQSLLQAETAVLECRFADAYPKLKSILKAPDDIVTEIGCLWNAGICCIALDNPTDFSKIFLRLKVLLSEDFPHRDDLVIILEALKTFVDTMDATSNDTTCNTDIHDQGLPLTWVNIGYTQLAKETMHSGTAEPTMLELGLRFLETTGSVISMEMMHCYLLGIYYIRNNMTSTAEKHAKAVIQLVFENKFYFPLVMFFPYFSPVLSPILAQYPKDFQNHCHELILQYEKNFTEFLSAANKEVVMSKLSETDYPYIYAVLTNLTNPLIADKLGVSQHTVTRRLAMICEKLGVTNKKDLKDYLHKYM